MRWLDTFTLRLRSLFRRARVEDELDTELQFHLQEQVEEHLAAGLSVEDARAAALRSLGSVSLTKEHCRESLGVRLVDEAQQDVRYALRTLVKNRAFTTVAVLSLALGIGANAAIFTVINALLFKTLPVKAPEQLVRFSVAMALGTSNEFSYPLFQEFNDQTEVVSGIAASGGTPQVRMTLGNVSAAVESVRAQWVSGNFFSVLGVDAVIGRPLVADDDRLGSPRPVVVMSHGLWTRRFGRDPGVVGQTISLNDTPFTIVGVAPPRFRGIEVGVNPDLWRPLQMLPRVVPGNVFLTQRNTEWLVLIGRLQPGVSPAGARSRMDTVYQRNLAENVRERAARLGPAFTAAERGVFLQRSLQLQSGATGWTNLRLQFRQPLFILMILVGLVLLIACANVANLVLARAAARHKEIAVRLAIGAARGRLIRQLLTESLLVAGVGGALGLVLSRWGTRLLLQYLPSRQIVLNVEPDVRILGFMVALTLVSAVVYGLMPALKATRSEDPASGLKNQGAGHPGRSGLTLNNALVVCQVALSLFLLIGASLFVRTLQNLEALDLGFERDHVTVFSLDLPSEYEISQQSTLYRRLQDRLQALPGVRSVSFSTFGLLSGSSWSDRVTVAGYATQSGEDTNCHAVIVGPRFFETMSMHVLTGRTFGSHDTQSGPRVAVVNETMARRFFGARDPIGGHFAIPGWPNESFEIVGVVADAKYRTVREAVPPTFYLHFIQTPGPSAPSVNIFVPLMGFELRSSGHLSALGDAVIRRTVQEIEPRAQVLDLQTMEEVVDASLAQERLVAQLTSIFGLLALLLASIGLYGVTSYAVARRTSEIGLRMALGASRKDVLLMVLRGSMNLIAAGAAIGVPLALVASRFVQSFLYGLHSTDPFAVGGAILLIGAVGITAGYLPAQKASQLDPMVALRHE